MASVIPCNREDIVPGTAPGPAWPCFAPPANAPAAPHA